jgi:DNA-binding response OmpR family regulator/DNA-binding CsgD family transcriptional regulator
MTLSSTPPPIVLIVDDTPANLSLLFHDLAERGYSVRIAENGATALEQMKLSKPDLVLLDVVMPGMNGFEVCRQIKSNPEWRALPILFMTALDEDEEKVNAFRAGAVDYITKPVHIPEVLARVGAHLEIQTLQASLRARNEELEEEIALRQEAEELLRHSLDQALLIVEPPHTIIFATRLAQNFLRVYFPEGDGVTLPPTFVDLLDRTDPPFHIKGPSAQLRISPLTTPTESTNRIFQLTEIGKPQNPAVLMQLGLTARQAEVLFWIAQGKTNPDIALILGAAVRTVQKHVEHIFQKLSVESRQAAALVALEVLKA